MKRGQRAAYRLTYRWSNGVTGSRPYFDAGDAEREAERMRARTGPDGATCEATVEPIRR